jgi:hypothetical protein
MPKTIAREDHRVLVTIGYLEKYPNMGVLDAMKISEEKTLDGVNIGDKRVGNLISRQECQLAQSIRTGHFIELVSSSKAKGSKTSQEP